jgi:hypothetical protein
MSPLDAEIVAYGQGFITGRKGAYLEGYKDATAVAIKRVEELLMRQKYGFDIDSRLLLDEIRDREEEVITSWDTV